jgi:hydrogenase expression/formation protein HypD
VGYVDHALALADRKEVTITTFGDLMRVPGSPGAGGAARTLGNARAMGADVRVVYSSLDALAVAAIEPKRHVVFLGVGFETTAPGLAATVLRAEAQKLDNFSMLSAAKTIPEAMDLLAGADDVALDGFLCPGHVSAILGTEPYRRMVEQHGLACAVAGFEPAEIVRGLASLLRQVKEDAPRVDNCYPGAVRATGNPAARAVMYRGFEPVDAKWRGLGVIHGSGLGIRDAFARFDAARRFDVSLPEPEEPAGCRCGEVLKGVIGPEACSLFGEVCTPEHPKGACMVSSEGSCAASYHYRLEEGL